MEILLFILAILIVHFLTKEKKNPKAKEKDFLKEKGDIYEKFIGQIFEKKGELVIYNGFIYGYADKGVDVISICVKRKTIHLIQCKDWGYKRMFLDDMEEIYQKLSLFTVETMTKNSRAIKKYLKIKKNLPVIESILEKDKSKFKVIKILYMSSAEVIDVKIGRQFKQIKSNIFAYKDMKIVIKKGK